MRFGASGRFPGHDSGCLGRSRAGRSGTAFAESVAAAGPWPLPRRVRERAHTVHRCGPYAYYSLYRRRGPLARRAPPPRARQRATVCGARGTKKANRRISNAVSQSQRPQGGRAAGLPLHPGRGGLRTVQPPCIDPPGAPPRGPWALATKLLISIAMAHGPLARRGLVCACGCAARSPVRARSFPARYGVYGKQCAGR